MSLGQPTPSTLSREVTDGAVLGYPKQLSISRVLHPCPDNHHKIVSLYVNRNTIIFLLHLGTDPIKQRGHFPLFTNDYFTNK